MHATRAAFSYLSRQHLIEQHTVGPPVHRLVIGLVGHDLQQTEMKGQRDDETESEKKSGCNRLGREGRRREGKREREKVGGRRRRKRERGR